MSKVYQIMVNKDEDIKEVITKYVLEKGWDNAYISGAIGSTHNAKLKTPNSLAYPPQTSTTDCYMPCEVLAFTGEIMAKNKMPEDLKEVYVDDGCPLFVHIHASLSATGAHVYGGGFHGGQAFRGLKVYIQPMEE